VDRADRRVEICGSLVARERDENESESRDWDVERGKERVCRLASS
jgi:hypothetical protein